MLSRYPSPPKEVAGPSAVCSIDAPFALEKAITPVLREAYFGR